PARHSQTPTGPPARRWASGGRGPTESAGGPVFLGVPRSPAIGRGGDRAGARAGRCRGEEEEEEEEEEEHESEQRESEQHEGEQLESEPQASEIAPRALRPLAEEPPLIQGGPAPSARREGPRARGAETDGREFP
ncbi:unnamed protein product, partial [Prorocentrum cordatum]